MTMTHTCVRWMMALAVLLALTTLGAQLLIQRATAPGQRAHSLARAALPGGDLALVAVPARPDRAGAVALWWAGTSAPRVRELISLPGAARRSP